MLHIYEPGDGRAIRAGRRATARDQQIAKEGSPLDVEFQTGRLPPKLEVYADLFARAYEQAHTPAHACPAVNWLDTSAEHPMLTKDDWEADPEGNGYRLKAFGIEAVHPGSGATGAAQQLLVALGLGAPVASVDSSPRPDALRGAEIRARSAQVCQMLAYRCGHLYRPVVDATVFARTMAEIGLAHGGNRNDAAKIGRSKVHDGLLFAKGVFDDLLRWEAQDAARDKLANYVGRKMKAIGRDEGLPDHWHTAANDNLRGLRDTA